MLYVIVGETGSGKTLLCNEFTQHGVDKVVTFTTRKRRPEESVNDYDFVVDEVFDLLDDEDYFVETDVYDGCKYGMSKASILPNKDQVVVLTLNGLQAVRHTGIDHVSVCVKAPLSDRQRWAGDRVRERECVEQELNDETMFDVCFVNTSENDDNSMSLFVRHILTLNDMKL